jgi:hypothetical protein
MDVSTPSSSSNQSCVSCPSYLQDKAGRRRSSREDASRRAGRRGSSEQGGGGVLARMRVVEQGGGGVLARMGVVCIVTQD